MRPSERRCARSAMALVETNSPRKGWQATHSMTHTKNQKSEGKACRKASTPNKSPRQEKNL
eukprot:15474285-Alexandrium_andersonii.AAC.1